MTLATSRPIRLRDTITAEIIKVATVPSTPIMLAVVLITNLALAVIDASKIGFYIQSDQTEPASISSCGIGSYHEEGIYGSEHGHAERRNRCRFGLIRLNVESDL